MVHCRDSPADNWTRVSGCAEICGSRMWRSFGVIFVPSASVTMSPAEIPTDTGECDTFFIVTVISNGTPGKTEALGRVRFASTACGEAPTAQFAMGRVMRRTKARWVSFIVRSFTAETDPGACGFQGIQNAICHLPEAGG